LCFHGSNGYGNASQCHVVRILPVLWYQYIQSAKICREQATETEPRIFLSITIFTLLFQCKASIHIDHARSSDMTEFSPTPWLCRVYLKCFNKLKWWVSHTKPRKTVHINACPQTVFTVRPKTCWPQSLIHFYLGGCLKAPVHVFSTNGKRTDISPTAPGVLKGRDSPWSDVNLCINSGGGHFKHFLWIMTWQNNRKATGIKLGTLIISAVGKPSHSYGICCWRQFLHYIKTPLISGCKELSLEVCSSILYTFYKNVKL
jgi:hypothetical protein